MLARGSWELRKLSRETIALETIDYTAATTSGSSKIFSKPSKFWQKMYDVGV